METTPLLFFECYVVKGLWNVVLEILEIDVCLDFESIGHLWIIIKDMWSLMHFYVVVL